MMTGFRESSHLGTVGSTDHDRAISKACFGEHDFNSHSVTGSGHFGTRARLNLRRRDPFLSIFGASQMILRDLRYEYGPLSKSKSCLEIYRDLNFISVNDIIVMINHSDSAIQNSRSHSERQSRHP